MVDAVVVIYCFSLGSPDLYGDYWFRDTGDFEEALLVLMRSVCLTTKICRLVCGCTLKNVFDSVTPQKYIILSPQTLFHWSFSHFFIRFLLASFTDGAVGIRFARRNQTRLAFILK